MQEIEFIRRTVCDINIGEGAMKHHGLDELFKNTKLELLGSGEGGGGIDFLEGSIENKLDDGKGDENIEYACKLIDDKMGFLCICEICTDIFTERSLRRSQFE